MAWRIDEAVVRGEIDNRVKGRVTGKIWFLGLEYPVELNLKGNAWRDVAGRLLTFENPTPVEMNLLSLGPNQHGVVGDITASRKVKVPEIPMSEIGEYYKQKKPFPWHWGNSLYLEWFSQRNGRVVIESAAFDLRIADESTWDMTEAEETEQREANGHAMVEFMERLTGAVTPDDPTDDDADSVDWDDDPVMTEDEADKLQAEQERLLDRIEARLEREGESADYEKILQEEMERLRQERGEEEEDDTWEEDVAGEWDEAFEKAAAELEENPELAAEIEKIESYQHPLVTRASDLFYAINDEAEAEGWIPEDAQSEHPVAELLTAIMSVGPKLAGALNGSRWPPELDFCALTIVRLKKAAEYADDAVRAGESCQEGKLIPAKKLGPILVEVVDIADEIDALITELRERLNPPDQSAE